MERNFDKKRELLKFGGRVFDFDAEDGNLHSIIRI